MGDCNPEWRSEGSRWLEKAREGSRRLEKARAPRRHQRGSSSSKRVIIIRELGGDRTS
jgi:hypothetical protein